MRLKKFLLVLLIFMFSASLIFAMGSPEQAKPESGAAESQPSQDQRVVPGTKGEVYFSFSGITKKVLPAVVELDVVEVVRQETTPFNFLNPFEFFFGGGRGGNNNNNEKNGRTYKEYERPGLGSGIMIKQDGDTVYVLTNSHVAGKADQITVKLADGQKFEAVKVGADDRMDLALVSFKCSDKVPLATFGDSDSLEVGDIVLAIGSPYGYESTVTMGIVSGLQRKSTGNVSSYTDYIQTDASINPGNSGGALVNMKGEVVGINTWIATQSGGSVGLGFAIPSNNAKRIANDFITKGKVEYGWLGVSIDTVDENSYPELRKDLGLGNKGGGLILGVFKGSPADKAGILPGDFITKINGTAISDSVQLTKVIGTIAPKEKATFTLIRNKKEMTLSVVLEARDEEDKVQANHDIYPGFLAINIDEKMRTKGELGDIKGVMIVAVSQGTAAEQANLRPGDIIQEINDKPVTNMLEFYNALNDKSNKKMFQISRKGQKIIIGIVK
ncbi:MAG: Do family serine endopeptidase [Spirochaetia bacterium]|nr:Do family serine endopeptidase [Spirochaetia bacterium]